MWKFLKDMFVCPPRVELGALPDTRSPEERARDYPIAEIVAHAAAVEWREIPQDQVRQFGTQDQGNKGSCVAETRRKLKRILFNVNKGLDLDFSAVAFYRKRSNYPAAGMSAVDAISLDRNFGMTLDKLVPSDTVTTETAANALFVDPYNDDVAKVFAVQPNEVTFIPGDMDTPAGTIQKTRKGVMMWFYFTYEEWAQEVPKILNNNLQFSFPSTLRHSVTGVEPALYDGVQGVWIEDSAHFGGFARRFITRAFYERRNVWASYPIAFKFEPETGNKPSYYGSTASLQDCLKWEGLFPSNVDSTGVYGPITTQAVKDFQKKYGLEQIGAVGPRTRAKLVELYP